MPIATAFAAPALATASGPTAMLSVPSAWLSAKTELVWKYLVPVL